MKIDCLEIILYVANQQKSRDFYAAVLQKSPALDVPGMTEFSLAENVKLGLMPEKGVAKILGERTPHPSKGNGIPRCELYLFTDNVEDDFERAKRAGAIEVSPIQNRDWGDRAGYLADADGHIIAFAEIKKL